MTKQRAWGSLIVASEWALRELPARAATFLHAAGKHAPIREVLAKGGYGAAEHQEGLSLLLDACVYQAGGTSPMEDADARAAEDALGLWARTHLPRLRTALVNAHERERLRAWVQAARRARAPEATAQADATSLRRLYEWHRDWSTTARTFIQRRDWLVRLGLLRRARSVSRG